MGQRSQIYIRYKNENGKQLIARYFGWNYGERMISRAKSIIEWLNEYKKYFSWLFDDKNKILELERVCDVNFDMRTVLISADIKQEIIEQFAEEAEENLKEYLFGQDNNDGQLLIDVSDGKIKYAFIAYYTEAENVMDAEKYMEWNADKDWKINGNVPEDAVEYTKDNIRYILENAELMTVEETQEFINYDYKEVVFGKPF